MSDTLPIKSSGRKDGDVGYTLPVALTLAVHAAVVAIALVQLPPLSRPVINDDAVVNATLVSTETFTDQAAFEQDLNDPLEPVEIPQPVPDAPPETPAPEVPEPEEAAPEEAEAEEILPDLEALEQARADAEAEAARRQEEAARAERERQQAEAEAEAERQRRQAEAEAEAERQRRQAEAEAEAERQRRQAEAEAEAERQRRQAEAEAEAERQRRQAEAEAEAERQRQQAEAEAAARARQAEEATNRFVNLVRRAVEQAWIIPADASSTMSVAMRVRLGPSGELLEVVTTQSSGNPGFDRSARQAVEIAAPFSELQELPIDLQRNMRQFEMRFSPREMP